MTDDEGMTDHDPNGCETGCPACAAQSERDAIGTGLPDKHTPGPWAIGLDSDEERTQVIAHDGGHMAYVEYSPTNANARLIAAAPTLLEALEEAAEALANNTHVENCTDPECWEVAAYEKAHAAIKAAKGDA